MALVGSAIRRASRKGRGFATPWGGMAERRPQRVAMQGRRAGQHPLFSSHLDPEQGFETDGKCLLLRRYGANGE
jgi:hypothetical protein